MKSVVIVGAGLSGCEAALQLANNGMEVTIYDIKPKQLLPPYFLQSYAELVCNNSLGNVNINTPLGLLLYELEFAGSQLIKIANRFRIDDGHFFSVAKKEFSLAVTNELKRNNIQILNKKVEKIPDADYTLIATGPMTNEKLLEDLKFRYGIDKYNFYDASSPVVDINSIELENENIFKISKDLYKVLIPDNIFKSFYKKLLSYEVPTIRNEKELTKFNKCHSIEQLAKNGLDALIKERFMYDSNSKPSLLLRREHSLNNGFILVGCMTMLRNSEQKEIFSLFPGFENCKFIKYGRVHRNTFLNSPGILNNFYQVKNSDIHIIGQLSGVDGYAPCISSGLVAASRIIYGVSMPSFSKDTMIGALANYISNCNVTDFQPMCASFSLLDDYEEKTERCIISRDLLSIQKKLLNNSF